MSLRRITGAATAALWLAASSGALAGDWTAKLPNGMELAIVEDPAGHQTPYRLERRQPGAGQDRSFGQGGSLPLNLGGDSASPTGLRVDAQGNIYVFGYTISANSARTPVLLRFEARGAPDSRWAAGGRLQVTGLANDLAPEDLLPQDDGKLLMIGSSQARGTRAVLWRLLSNGQIDSSFGANGQLSLQRDQSSEGVALAAAGADFLIGVVGLAEAGSHLEVHRWSPSTGGDPMLVGRQPAPEAWVGQPVLEQRQDRWGWLASADNGASRAWVAVQMLKAPAPAAWREGAAPVPVAEASASRPGSEGSVAFNPYANAPAAPASAPAAAVRGEESVSSDWLMPALAAALIAAALVWWRRRGR